MATKTVRRTISMTPEMHDLLMLIVVKRERDVKEVDRIHETIREYLDEQAAIVGSRRHFQKSLRARLDQLESAFTFHLHILIYLLSAVRADESDSAIEDAIIAAKRDGDTSLSPDDINVLAQAARDLRKSYPMFAERKFDVRDEFGRVIGSFFGMFSEAQLLHTLARRLSERFRSEPEQVITEARVQAAANHPYGRVLLNLLLPRKEIPNPLEKLY